MCPKHRRNINDLTEAYSQNHLNNSSNIEMKVWKLRKILSDQRVRREHLARTVAVVIDEVNYIHTDGTENDVDNSTYRWTFRRVITQMQHLD